MDLFRITKPVFQNLPITFLFLILFPPSFGPFRNDADPGLQHGVESSLQAFDMVLHHRCVEACRGVSQVTAHVCRL